MIVKSIFYSMCVCFSFPIFACSQTNDSSINSILRSEKSVLKTKILTKYKSYKVLKNLNRFEKKWYGDDRKLVVLVNQADKQKPCIAFELASTIEPDCSVETKISSINYISEYVCKNYL